MTTKSMLHRPRRAALIVVASLPLATFQASAQAKRLLIGSTTSTEDSGLFAYLLPVFEKATGIQAQVISMGTGRAFDLAQHGDVDVVLAHNRPLEEKFVADGWGLLRRNVMYNDFVLIGPKSDRAGVRGKEIVTAFAKLATSASETFISRSDRSGTHAAELRYWKAAGIEAPQAKMALYQACDCGMAQALNIASTRDFYVLADRGTWLTFQNRDDLTILVEGDPRLINQYGVVVVNPAKHPQVRCESAQAFADWLVSQEGQQAIASFRVGGEQLFFPNATH